jgi:hypothetical protein
MVRVSASCSIVSKPHVETCTVYWFTVSERMRTRDAFTTLFDTEFFSGVILVPNLASHITLARTVCAGPSSAGVHLPCGSKHLI